MSVSVYFYSPRSLEPKKYIPQVMEKEEKQVIIQGENRRSVFI